MIQSSWSWTVRSLAQLRHGEAQHRVVHRDHQHRQHQDGQRPVLPGPPETPGPLLHDRLVGHSIYSGPRTGAEGTPPTPPGPRTVPRRFVTTVLGPGRTARRPDGWERPSVDGPRLTEESREPMPTLLSPLLASAEHEARTSPASMSRSGPGSRWSRPSPRCWSSTCCWSTRRRTSSPSRKTAIESAIWISIGLAFGLVMIVWHGGQAGAEYYAGFLIEKSLRSTTSSSGPSSSRSSRCPSSTSSGSCSGASSAPSSSEPSSSSPASPSSSTSSGSSTCSASSSSTRPGRSPPTTRTKPSADLRLLRPGDPGVVPLLALQIDDPGPGHLFDELIYPLGPWRRTPCACRSATSTSRSCAAWPRPWSRPGRPTTKPQVAEQVSGEQLDRPVPDWASFSWKPRPASPRRESGRCPWSRRTRARRLEG